MLILLLTEKRAKNLLRATENLFVNLFLTIKSMIMIIISSGHNGKRGLWYQQLRKSEVNYRSVIII